MPEKKRKKIKVQDLKPKKDAKGGVLANVNTSAVTHSHSTQGHNVQDGGGHHQTNLHI